MDTPLGILVVANSQCPDQTSDTDPDHMYRLDNHMSTDDGLHNLVTGCPYRTVSSSSDVASLWQFQNANC